MIQLYINKQLVDITDGTDILFTKEKTDFTNPTVIKNIFSKTVSLPSTQNNDNIFNQIWSLDRMQTANIYNPSKRVSFEILRDGDLVESGYIKLDSISRTPSGRTYNCTLFGELGNILYGLAYDDDGNELTLGDLTYEFDLGFTINKNVILAAWSELDYLDEQLNRYNTLNFMPAFNGVPSDCKNFDATYAWASATGWPQRGYQYTWNGNIYDDGLPDTYNDGTYTYGTPSVLGEHLGRLTMPREVTDIEMRDFRSYLQRPVIRLKKVINAIGSKINENTGYTLQYDDDINSILYFKWITLSMLYTINKEVETGTYFSQKELLKETSTPASYLTSFCKTFGIFIDVDSIDRKVYLRRLPNFYIDEIKELKVNEKEVNITPLSFSSNIYSFDYGDGDGEAIQNYKDKYDLKYGSKKVKTGYEFDSDEIPYIDENVFVEGIDVTEMSEYYRYPTPSPAGLCPLAYYPKYALFRFTTGNEFEEKEAQIEPMSYLSQETDGYFGDYEWAGLQVGNWSSYNCYLQCHTDNNSAVSGKNILVDNHSKTSLPASTYWKSKNSWESMNWGTQTLIPFSVSDDIKSLKELTDNKNCWLNLRPGTSESTYWKMIYDIPNFTRCAYDYTDYSEVMYKGGAESNWYDWEVAGTGQAATPTYYKDRCVIPTSITGGWFCSEPESVTYPANHTYFVGALYQTSSLVSSGDNNIYPEIGSGQGESTILDKITYKLNNTDASHNTDGTIQVIASICKAGDEEPFGLYIKNTSNGKKTLWGFVVYDMTDLDIPESTPIYQMVKYAGLDVNRVVGIPLHITDTIDFGEVRELYVDGCSYDLGVENINVFDQYWKNFITDLYDVNTRVFEAQVRIENVQDAFRYFYHYENSLWVLSKISDYDYDTRLCTAQFIKVNRKENYLPQE